MKATATFDCGRTEEYDLKEPDGVYGGYAYQFGAGVREVSDEQGGRWYCPFPPLGVWCRAETGGAGVGGR